MFVQIFALQLAKKHLSNKRFSFLIFEKFIYIMNVLICFTELAEYTIACANEFIEQSGATVHIIRWPINDEAPFKFTNLNSKIVIYERNKYSEQQLLELAKKINPKLILTSGWIDKGYMKVAKAFYKKVPTVLLMDNKWQNTIKQNIARIVSPLILKTRFSHCFVPGIEQVTFAKKLGYLNENIITGYYSCDYKRFKSISDEFKESKKKMFPQKFIYIGRYYDFKGLPELWEAFIELQNENENDWELWCLGTGDLLPPIHSKIKHFGFVQPKDLSYYLKETGVFVMPSRVEPWGVVLHEMVTSGFPVICSKNVGSAVAFLRNNVNGFEFETGNKISLKNKLKKIMEMPVQELITFSQESEKLAETITPKIWSESLKKLIKI
jgi:glycosyltransferase involved in cell wall biosynthesis